LWDTLAAFMAFFPNPPIPSKHRREKMRRGGASEPNDSLN
jgi:hypothetical protein